MTSWHLLLPNLKMKNAVHTERCQVAWHMHKSVKKHEKVEKNNTSHTNTHIKHTEKAESLVLWVMEPSYCIRLLWGNHEKSLPTEHRPACLQPRQTERRQEGHFKSYCDTAWQYMCTSEQTHAHKRTHSYIPEILSNWSWAGQWYAQSLCERPPAGEMLLCSMVSKWRWLLEWWRENGVWSLVWRVEVCRYFWIWTTAPALNAQSRRDKHIKNTDVQTTDCDVDPLLRGKVLEGKPAWWLTGMEENWEAGMWDEHGKGRF